MELVILSERAVFQTIRTRLASHGIRGREFEAYIGAVMKLPEVQGAVKTFFERIVWELGVNVARDGEPLPPRPVDWKARLRELAEWLPVEGFIRGPRGGIVQATVFKHATAGLHGVVFAEGYAATLLAAILRKYSRLDLRRNSITVFGTTYTFASRRDLETVLDRLGMTGRVEEALKRRILEVIPPRMLATAIREGKAKIDNGSVTFTMGRPEWAPDMFDLDLKVTVESDIYTYPDVIVTARATVRGITVASEERVSDGGDVVAAIERAMDSVRETVLGLSTLYRAMRGRYGKVLITTLSTPNPVPAVEGVREGGDTRVTLTVGVHGGRYTGVMEYRYLHPTPADARLIAVLVEEKVGVKVAPEVEGETIRVSATVQGDSVDEVLSQAERLTEAITATMKELSSGDYSPRKTVKVLGEDVAAIAAYAFHHATGKDYMLIVGVPAMVVHRRLGRLLRVHGLRPHRKKVDYRWKKVVEDVARRLAVAGLIRSERGRVLILGKPFEEIAEAFMKHAPLITEEDVRKAEAFLRRAIAGAGSVSRI